jgi:tetratricopeptide (TPR) repeat protein
MMVPVHFGETPMRHGRLWLALTVPALLGWGVISLAQPPKRPAPPPPAEEPAEEPSAEDAREAAIAERFRKVLETNPRRGTALDRLYGYHVERGTIDQLVKTYTDRTAKDPKDGIAWMVVGLVESQRGRDAAAVAAFRKAEDALPDNAIPGYYLGQSLVLVGQPDAAAEAFERAITRKPNRNDLLDTFQALGRVYQRAQRTDKALAVWDRLEKLYPDDARVQEQIATTLTEEGQLAQALPRVEKLAAQTDDKYRQAALKMDAADLKVRLKRTPDALADFEKLLADLNPESWLYRDVRRRIEDVFLRNDDLAGLAKYYESWLAKNATDVDAIARLAKTLTSQGRTPDARAWLEKGTAAAPTNRALRQALIDQYVFVQDYPAAAAQYEAMDKADPNNPDTLREWGKLLLKDTAKPEADRKAAAAAVWKRMLAKKPNDPVTASQVADLLRTGGVTDEAVALYKKAIELAPAAAQYREYLGEYLHSQGKSAEALATWRPIAEGANRTAKNLVRLAEVMAGFGYRKEAVAAMADAVSLEKDDFTTLMTYADLLNQDAQYDAALAQVDAASRLTSNPEEVEQVLAAQIKVYQETEKLGDKIDELQKELDAGKDPSAERWLRLARYYEANRQADKATVAVVKAGERDPKSVPVLIAAARVNEAAGNLLAAADTNRKLAALDRRFRSEYLQAVAKLEQRLGRREQALQAGRDVLAASPGNPEVYKFYADLCFQLGDQDEGLEALRRSVRANPSDPAGLLTLANALAERVRQGEAIELLWRAFEKTNELEGRLSVIDRITQLYLENNQFDRLMERLDRERREAEKAREMTLCVAQAYATAGDLGTARQQLERLLTENSRDTHLLGQLSTLCEQEGDLAAALKFQRQLVAAAPNNYDHQLKLAQLLTKGGEPDEAADIWVKLVANEPEPHRNLAAIDQLLTATKYDAALAITSRLLARKPGNWELMYREGAALAGKGKTAEAGNTFRAILALRQPDDELGAVLKHRYDEAKRKAKNPDAKPGGSAARPAPAGLPARPSSFASVLDESESPPLSRRKGNVYQVRRAVGAEVVNYGGGYVPPAYTPADFGEARMACLGWLNEFARAKDGGADAFAKEMKAAKDKPDADGRALWDWYYFQLLRAESKEVVPAALALSKTGDPAGLVAYLSGLGDGRQGATRTVRAGGTGKDNTPPLPADQLLHALACYRKLQQVKPTWATNFITQSVMAELKRAKRDDEEKAIYQELVAGADTVAKVQTALGVAAARNDKETCYALYAKLEKLQPAAKKASALGQLPTRLAWSSLQTLMGRRADAKDFADSRAVLDLFLSTARRQNLAAPKAASVSRRARPTGTGVTLYSKNPAGRTNTTITYPNPNDYYDSGSITLLYNAFNLHKQGDVLSDLFAHFKKQLDAAPPGAEKLYLRLALGYLHWWNNDKEEALNQLTAAVKDAPDDHGLLLEVADLREKNGEPDAALTLLDSITPPDTQTMQAREEAALRSAEKTGNLDRARQAAERLFGLRLDADKQLDLAGKMYRLGLHELAETVLGRAQRQAGNKSATLLKLMSQYQSQGQTDLAVQIARQVLRKGPSGTFNPRGGGTEVDTARQQAIGVLARSGQIKEMIERAEAQLKASPKSVQIYQALTAYYQAAGDKAKLKDALLKMADLKPDDGKLRYTVAQQLQQGGDNAAALTQYTAAIKLDPSLFGNNYYELIRAFSQQNKYEDLGKLVDEMDVRKVRYYYAVANVVGDLLRNEKTKEIGMRLFKKGWEAFPQERGSFLGQMDDEAVWRLPEIYDYARQAVIPKEDSTADPWQSAEQIMSYGQEGRVDGVITRMMAIARKQQRLPELRTEVAAALTKRPDWVGGKAMLAVIDIQTGRKDEGKKLWQEAFADPKVDVPPLARFILAQELEHYAGAEDVAVPTLEAGVEDLVKDGNYDFSYSPARRLIWWYEHLGRGDEAKKLLVRLSKIEATDPGYGGGYWQYRTTQSSIAFAQAMQKLGDPVSAVRVYQKLLADPDALLAANQYGGGQFNQQIESGLKAALKATKPDDLAAAVESLLTPQEGAAAGAALDPVLLVESRDLTKSTLTGMLATVLKGADKVPAVRRAAAARTAELAKKHPDDVSVRTAAAVAAFAGGSPDAAREAVGQLVKLVEATPLDALPDGKANARQRAEALRQVQLWLAAKECLARDDLRDAGVKLAERAVAAAKRQQDPTFAAAVLREWGQLDLDRGDKAKAEARWAEMFDLVVPKPPAKKPAAPMVLRPREPGMVFVQVPLLKSPPTAAAGPRRAGNVPVLTAEQFEKAYQVATLAAEKNMPALSLRAITDAVRGGPPVQDPNQNRNGGGSYSTYMYNGTQYMVQRGGKQTTTPDMALSRLVPKWREIGVPPADIYAVLAATALPAARPAEVFAFGEARKFSNVYKMVGGSWTQTDDPVEEGGADRGLCALLCDLAVEAGKVDDLRARAEARANQPLGEIPARVLLTTLAVTAKDDARAAEALKVLADKAGKTTVSTALDPVAAAALAALARPALEEQAAALMQKVAMQLAVGNNLSRAQQVGEQLVTHYLEQLPKRDFAKAKTLIDLAATVGQRMAAGNADQLPLKAAEMYLRAGYADDALKQLGVYTDAATVAAAAAPAGRRNRREEPTVVGFERLVRLLLEMPADKRYEALKGWTLPAEGRKSIRYFVGTTPAELPPPAFVKLPPVPADRILSTMVLLAEAAKECGKGDELLAAADKAVADKVENAVVFAVLVKLALGKGKDAEPAVKAYAEATRKRLTVTRDPDEQQVRSRYYYDGEDQGPIQARPSEWLVASLCLADPALEGYGADLLKPIADRAANQNPDLQRRAQAARERQTAAKAGAPDAAAGGRPAGWHTNTPRSAWVAQDGYLAAAASSLGSLLVFGVPLAGTFEFSVETDTTAAAGYGGVVYQPAAFQGGSAVWTIGGDGDSVSRPGQFGKAAGPNTLTFQVSPGKVRGLVNGDLFYEDADAPPTSPWLTLVASEIGRPAYRNPVLSGKPEVPAEVKLTAGDFLDGWGPHLSTGSMPKRLTAKEPKPTGPQYDPNTGEEKPPEEDESAKKYDWRATAGEVVGRKLDRPGAKPVPAALAYFRPLRAGETVRYEFFHEPGKTHVDPSLGRCAFLLDPAGVKLHYLTDAADGWTDLAADNAVDDPAGRKANPKLKAGDWNTVALSTTADRVKVEVNGEVVYDGALPAGAGRKFGLFHYRDRTAARVRNVVLTGDWAKAVEPAAVAFAAPSATPTEARARRKLIGEGVFAAEAGGVLDRAKKLPPAERVEALAAWVLPTDARPALQLAGVVRTGDAPPGVRTLPAARFEAPVLEMIAAAKEAGALDALAGRIAKLDPPGADAAFQRGKAALLAVVRAAGGRDAEAADGLAKLRGEYETLPLDADAAERWPGLVAVVGCSDRPALLKPAEDLAETMLAGLRKSSDQKKGFDTLSWWLPAVRAVKARVTVAAQPDGVRRPFGSDPGLRHWVPASGLEGSGDRRANDWPPHWTVRDGTVTHYPGRGEDFLMLRTPLRGDFEVTAELRAKAGRQAHVRYGGYQFELRPDRKTVWVSSTIRSGHRTITITPPLPETKAETYQFKLAVKDGWVRSYVDGRELSAERLGPAPEPWLMVHCDSQSVGDVANLRITGTPAVPASLDILAGDDIPLWQPHNGGIGSASEGRVYRSEGDTTWMKRGEELSAYGKRPDPPEDGKPAPPRGQPESVVYYQRPLAEDGAVEYEFFYDPDKRR